MHSITTAPDQAIPDGLAALADQFRDDSNFRDFIVRTDPGFAAQLQAFEGESNDSLEPVGEVAPTEPDPAAERLKQKQQRFEAQHQEWLAEQKADDEPERRVRTHMRVLGISEEEARRNLDKKPPSRETGAASRLPTKPAGAAPPKRRGKPKPEQLYTESPDGYGFRRTWENELTGCRKVTPSAALTGLAMSRISDWRSATVYAAAETLAAAMKRSSDKGSVLGWRRTLIERGWLTDTGFKSGRTAIYRLTIPACDCKACGRESPDRTDAEVAVGNPPTFKGRESPDFQRSGDSRP
ncbi:hypothetical protein [Amycolatopsis sp. cmx-4-68]|uniref:hypothetical protein n=1 Tax=Amycolatopsis sp. cmx-4-68 TaxID=2790938 RepID=UPI003979194B